MNGMRGGRKCVSALNVNPLIGIKRECTKCGQLQPITEFKKKVRGLYGRASMCRTCNLAYEKQRRSTPEMRDHLNEACRLWRINNPDKDRLRAKRNKLKIRSTPKGRLNSRISSLMNSSLKSGKQGSRWEVLAGYTVNDLKKHLEKHFLPGMSWGNISQWHIDHIIPISAFNYETPDDLDFKRCWALKNLRPLWAVDNIRKKDTLERPFQPALNITV